MPNHEQAQEGSSFNNPPKDNWFGTGHLCPLQGFWLPDRAMEAAMEMKNQFQFLPDDIILASYPKTGTTWLKALVYSIVNPHSSTTDPLLTHNPHQLIPFLERLLLDRKRGTPPNLTGIPSPRIISTHLPYELLEDNIRNSDCRIIYITRNPRDTIISLWHFSNTIAKEPFPLEDVFESFCSGVIGFGPFFKHVLGYWKEREKNVHFVSYEDMKEDTPKQVKKLADFLGCPLDSEEEIDELVQKCSYERLSNLEVNKRSEIEDWSRFPHVAYFRRGVVGDWRDYFTPEMIERLDGITRTELDGSGLQFKMLSEAIGKA